MQPVHFVVPGGIHDPDRPSGGNEYDRRIARGLALGGRPVHLHEMAGAWPQPDATAVRGLADMMTALPDCALIVVDSLIASAGAPVLVAAARRLRLVVLVHMLFGLESDDRDGSAAGERAVLEAAAAIITTSRWARDRVLALCRVAPGRVHVAPPGAEAAVPTRPSADGSRLSCVGAVIPHKGQQVLVAALAMLADCGWTCDLVGAADAAFAGRLGDIAAAAGIADRVRLRGPVTGAGLDDVYARSDLLVHPSLSETYGMVITEALARGVPVIGTAVGGVPEALGRTEHGSPGVLVAAGDKGALAGALRDWLTDARLRRRLRLAAGARRATLDGWETTSARIEQALSAAGR